MNVHDANGGERRRLTGMITMNVLGVTLRWKAALVPKEMGQKHGLIAIDLKLPEEAQIIINYISEHKKVVNAVQTRSQAAEEVEMLQREQEFLKCTHLQRLV